MSGGSDNWVPGEERNWAWGDARWKQLYPEESAQYDSWKASHPGRFACWDSPRPTNPFNEELCGVDFSDVEEGCGENEVEETQPERLPLLLPQEIVEVVEEVRNDASRVSNKRKRLQATAFFLTYSQSKLTRAQIEVWCAKQPRVKRLIAATEHHKDGHVHYHILVEYENQKDVTPKYFDILSEHPNVQVWKRQDSYEKWLYDHWKYCTKEDAECYIRGDAPEMRKRKRDDIAALALKKARELSVEDGMDVFEEYAPYDLVTKYQQIFHALQSARNLAVAPMSVARLVDAFPNRPTLPPEWHALFLYGDTDTGKTAFARALLPKATVVRHRDQLRDCDFSNGVIFDDFDVSHWPATAVIHLLDWDEASGVDVKHSHVIIPAHTRKIFTHNQSFRVWCPEKASEEQLRAIERRLVVVPIYNKLY